MKNFLLTLILLFCLSDVSAQYYSLSYPAAGKNPGGLNTDGEYPVGGGLPGGWTTVIAGSKSTPAWTNRIKLPFTFNFNGTDYDSCYISSSGVLTFSAVPGTAPAYANTNLPDASLPDNSVCIRGLKPDGGFAQYANVVTKTFGTAGKRQFYVMYIAYNESNIADAAVWFSMVLEEGSNRIYFVDQRKFLSTNTTAATKLTLGVQVNATTAYTVKGSPNVNLTSGDGGEVLDNSYWVMVPGTPPQYSISGYKITTPKYLAMVKAPFVINGDFKNIGSTTITSCDINYTVNNGPVETSPATVSISADGNAVVTSTSKWTPGSIGTYKVTVWLSNLNGNADDDGSDDSLTRTVQILDDFVTRIPLHEVFTSSTCGPCVIGNRNTDEKIFPKYPAQDFTVIKYQMSWPSTGDPYTTAEGNVRRALYNVTSIPNMQVDGGWNSNASNYSTVLYDQFKEKPAFFSIEASHIINFKKVTVDVKVTPVRDYNNANLKVFVAVLEKKTTKNVKTNGETEFHHVLKKMLPNANGTALGNVVKYNAVTFPTLTYNVPGDYRLPSDGQNANIINLSTENSIEELTDCEVVVFIQDVVTKEIFQSVNSSGTILSVDDINAGSNSISIYPNPSNGNNTYLSFQLNNAEGVNVRIYNALGQVVYEVPSTEVVSGMNSLQIPSANFASGIYTVKIEGNGFAAAQKFIVQ